MHVLSLDIADISYGITHNMVMLEAVKQNDLVQKERTNGKSVPKTQYAEWYHGD